MKSAIVLSVELFREMHYIHEQPITIRQFDQKVVPRYTPKVEEAKQFLNEQEAATYRDQIHNPHDRVFLIAKVKIDSVKEGLPRRAVTSELE